MVLNPAQFRLLLAGPRVSRLLPFFSARGYIADAVVRGSEALALLQQSPRHILLVELDLEDMLCGDLLISARQQNLAGAVLLLEDPAKTGLIVSTLVRGVDGYVATPPDEAYLFRVVERQLLAQWAIAQGAEAGRDAEDKARLERQLQQERTKVTDLVKELGTLRTEVSELKKQNRKPPPPAAGSALPRKSPKEEPLKKKGSSEAPWNVTAEAPKKSVNDARTAPRGYPPPAASNTFDEASQEHTRLGDPREKSPPGAGAKGKATPPAAGAQKKGLLDDEDLLALLDDATGSTNLDASAGATDDDDFLNLDE